MPREHDRERWDLADARRLLEHFAHEIGRALARSARVFLFDEPNSALTDEESTDLFKRMHALFRALRTKECAPAHV